MTTKMSTLLSWNVLYENHSELKQNFILKNIHHYDVLCLQEVILDSFESDFNPLLTEYDYTRHERNKRRTNNFGNVILWKKSKYTSTETSNDKSSCSVYVKLVSTYTGFEFKLINVHLRAGRIKGHSTRISQINSILKSYSESPCIICGDFNSTTEYQNDALDILLKNNFYLHSAVQKRGTCLTSDGWVHIDHILSLGDILKDYQIGFDCDDNNDYHIPNSTFLSDHLPIIAKIA